MGEIIKIRFKKREKLALLATVIVVAGIALFLSIDLDSDGLNNFAELQHGTSIFGQDTDRDGVLDGREVVLGTNPLSPEYISINANQQGDNLIVFGTTSLPDKFNLSISIPNLSVSSFCSVENHQYEYKLQRSVNALSAKIQVLISCEETKTENNTEINWTRVNNPPISDFTYVQDGHEVKVTDESSDVDGTIVRWNWSFGPSDGVRSDQNPTFTYANRGTYEIRLTVTDSGGAQTTCTKTIAVSDTFSYTWHYNGRRWYQELEIVDELDKYTDRSHSVYDYELDVKNFVTPDEPKIKEFAENLEANYLTYYPMDEYELANFVLRFIQETIPYYENRENPYRWTYALEALVEGKGDCSDKSTLYASLLEAFGYQTALIISEVDGHMMVGVHLDKELTVVASSGYVNAVVRSFEIDGVKYWSAETTYVGWVLGECCTDIHTYNALIFPV